MPKNYLSIYSEQLATKTESLCQNVKTFIATYYSSIVLRTNDVLHPKSKLLVKIM